MGKGLIITGNIGKTYYMKIIKNNFQMDEDIRVQIKL